ncbi:MAG: division/cell wall cluster transcriptional repressor MraZ [Lacisediminihabitans sp.]
MFLGTYAPKLDDKGRVILPAKFWAELESGLVVTLGLERCLYVYSSREFEEIHKKLRATPAVTKQDRDYLRMFLSGANAEVPDAQRRVTIPAQLRAYAGLQRELTVVGVGNHAEIWDTAVWEKYYAEQSETFATLTEEVIPGLF